MNFGKHYRETAIAQILDPVRRAEEYDADLMVIDAKNRLWKLHEKGARHYEYDPGQEGEFRRIYRPWDFGKRSAVQFWQMVKMGPTPTSCQLRCLGEICTYGALVHEVANEVHVRMTTWFAEGGGHNIPCIDYPDVAGRQSNRQTGKTDMLVISEFMRKWEPGFYADSRRVGVREGISVGARKMKEILGYDAEGRAVVGLVVSPLRAPTTLEALQGRLRQSKEGEIEKSKANKQWEHVGDTSRYVFARIIRPEDIVTGHVSTTREVITEVKLDSVKYRQVIQSNLANAALAAAMQRQAVEMVPGQEEWAEDGES